MRCIYFKRFRTKNRFIAFGKGENGLSVTRGWKGCQSIEMFESREDPNKIIIWQSWDSKEDQKVMFNIDTKTEPLILGQLVACPPRNITY